MIHYEDLEVGGVFEGGGYEVTAEEVVEFAERYDPQPFHTDEAAARESIYGGLIASGWHTGAMTMRMIVDGFMSEAASLGSPGLEELRWTEPVRPGDTLSIRSEVVDKRELESRPDRGMARIEVETLNDDGEVVMSMTTLVLFGRRDG